MSDSAVRDKPLLLYGLARNRRSPKRPSEPRPSGVHPEEARVAVCAGELGWKLLTVPGADGLSAVRWRLQNLAKIDKEKRAALIARLQKILQLEEPS